MNRFVDIDMSAGKRRSIGIDIGGTKIRIAAVEYCCELVSHAEIPTEAGKGFDRALERINATLEEVMKRVGWVTSDLRGIGIGCAGPVNPFEGTINNPYTLPGWKNCNIVRELYDRFNGRIPVFLENDGDTALVGEWYAGAAKGFDTVLMLTFGTGIGGGVLVNGGIYRGICGEHPEYGHIPVDTEGPSCYCGRSGCFESIASGMGLAAAGQKEGFIDSREVFEAYKQKSSERASKVMKRTLRAISTAAWTFLHTFMPECIIIGGTIGEKHFDVFEECFQQAVRQARMVPSSEIKVVKAELGNRAGMVGASCLPFYEDKTV